YLELDLGGMNLNETKFLSDIKVPEGIVITDLVHGKNTPIASIHAPRAEEVEPTPEEVAAVAVPVEGAVAAAPAAAGPPGAPGAAPPATPAAGAEVKKDEKAAAPAKEKGKK
ncbi:MAG: hypothetical protein ACRETT_16430, partial [Steroidobacteraceae bacterium]